MILTLTNSEFLYLRRLMASMDPPPGIGAEQAQAHVAIGLKLETILAESVRRQRDKIKHPEEYTA